MYQKPRFLLAGDKGLVVEFGNKIDPDINNKVRALKESLEASPIPGIEELMPTYRAILIYYNPLQIEIKELMRILMKRLKDVQEFIPPPPRRITVPVCYGGEYGPDMESVCEHTGLSINEVIQIHTSVEYLVYAVGFTPGFPLLGGMDQRIECPRLKIPRTKIPGGSVGIGGKQTGIYPIDSPGGWQLIGRTPIKLFNPNSEPPVLFAQGDYIRFKSISSNEYENILEDVIAGRYEVQIDDGNKEVIEE